MERDAPALNFLFPEECSRLKFIHNRIGMPVDDFPGTIFPAINVCYTQGDRTNGVAPLHACVIFFDPDGVTHVLIHALRKRFKGSLSLEKALPVSPQPSILDQPQRGVRTACSWSSER